MRKKHVVIAWVLVVVIILCGCHFEKDEKPEELRACWVASIGNLDFPSAQGLSAVELQKEMDAIIENCLKMGLNTIFFQVRPTGDALYPSDYFPWSAYLSGRQGQAPHENFDCLAYFIKKAHAADLELHAWINPYRIGSDENSSKQLSADNPAILHPEYTISCKAGLYYDPGLPEVRRLILLGVAELVDRYEIDGIHFDDYFYPYDMTGFDDRRTYEKYGGNRSLEEFRRCSVDLLVEAAYMLVKRMNEKVEFGISPFGIWSNKEDFPEGSATRGMSSYLEIFSDSKKWVDSGWVDYICPQIYWSRENTVASYNVLVDWWDDLCSEASIPFVVGLAAYKVGSEEVGWESHEEILSQIQYAKRKESYHGYSLFRYGVLKDLPALRADLLFLWISVWDMQRINM